MKKRKSIVVLSVLVALLAVALYCAKSRRVRSFFIEKMSVHLTQNGLITEDSIHYLSLDFSGYDHGQGIEDNSEDVTHPSICYNPIRKEYLLAVTPYPQASSKTGEYYENTCIFFKSEGCNKFSPISSNPIIKPIDCKFNSDPDIFFDESDSTYYCLTRQRHSPKYKSLVVMQHSKDGKIWSSPVPLFGTNRQSLCPCLLKVNDTYYIVCFNTKDYVSLCESEEIWESRSLKNPEFKLAGIYDWNQKDISIWHGDILYYEGKYYITSCGISINYMNEYSYFGGRSKYLWFGESDDLISWNFIKKPIVQKEGVYRSTFFIDENKIVNFVFSVSGRIFDDKHESGNQIGELRVPLSILKRQLK